jgi:hypothetical protein
MPGYLTAGHPLSLHFLRSPVPVEAAVLRGFSRMIGVLAALLLSLDKIAAWVPAAVATNYDIDSVPRPPRRRA